ncbi:LysR substrate-binding domain-containing protein [Larsenimonas suaedae]|uniref:LysR substrate-binding domain-containing protein n=1 Tax=Larsenimonas suaedae TaxID=1851019 RepID=A0ABU1GW37_9GAMM|nr:LysR substrate-binding domain-containing protein [Larsenimonas suaedae]MCM2973368.1 LysR substrate-binding domain-containing protein [Larsenimonas suaedae]MDR5896261.1 LysR substrate-binding domain-containing protein [Larsenimonas suaedae]
MNLQQLRLVREVVRRRFNLTEAANALFTSQSGASKHIRDLEDELGVELFERRGKRLLGLTPVGATLTETIERILLDSENLKRLAQQWVHDDQGRLRIATTHTQARYILPAIIARFRQDFPRVHLELQQCDPGEVVSLLRAGKVDIGMATEALSEAHHELATFPFHHWQHGVVVPDGHPLCEVPAATLGLADIARYPIVTYHEGFTGRSCIDQAFAAAGVVPEVAMSALDADVIKTYVELRLGIGILASIAFDPARDAGLVMLDTPDFFERNTTLIAVRRGHLLRNFAYRFLECCAPELDRATLSAAVAPV